MCRTSLTFFNLQFGTLIAYGIFSKIGKPTISHMNVLIQLMDRSTDRELKEFTEGKNDRVFITHSIEDSINILSHTEIHKAVISLKSLKDTAILKYINEYYTAIHVVVLANKAFDEIISIFSKSNYSVIHEPLKLSELKGKLHNSHTGTKQNKHKIN